MRWEILLCLTLVTTGLAGCIGNQAEDTDTLEQNSLPTDELSPRLYDILPVQEAWLPTTSDDQRIHTAVYRPDTDEPVPVFINFSPYWGDTAETRGDGFGQYMIEEYVPRGYAVVLASIRGTGHSEGCFQIAGDKELQDIHDVVDHVAKADWSNGHIAAGGKSYDSTPQNGMIAKVPHEALKGIFHVSGITDMYRYNYRGGVSYGHGTIFNTYYYLQGTDEYGVSLLSQPTPEGLMSEDADSLARAVDDAACPELPAIQANGVASGVAGIKTDYWIERDWNRYVSETDWNGSIFFVHGLQDWNVKPDHILPWLENLPEDIKVKGWLHQNTENNGHVYPMRADWNQTMLAWMDHVLKGKDTGLQWGFESEGTDGLWRASQTWPPAGTMQTVVPEMEDQAGTSPMTTNLTGTIASAEEAPKRYAGAPSITVTATADSSDPVLTAVLYDKGPDGELTWVNEAVLRGVYRGGLEAPDPIVPGEPFEATLELFPQDDILEPGHQWIISLGDMPRYTEPTEAQVGSVTYTEVHGVEMPWAPADMTLEQQPEPVPCFAC